MELSSWYEFFNLFTFFGIFNLFNIKIDQNLYILINSCYHVFYISIFILSCIINLWIFISGINQELLDSVLMPSNKSEVSDITAVLLKCFKKIFSVFFCLFVCLFSLSSYFIYKVFSFFMTALLGKIHYTFFIIMLFNYLVL